MQQRQLAHWHWKAELCSCGRPVEECSDPARPWYGQRSVCYAAMELASVNAIYDAIHEDEPYHDGTFKAWRKERSAQTPFHYRDGVSIWVAKEDLNPDDLFLTKQREADAEEVDDLGHTP